MSERSTVQELVVRWQELREQGLSLSVEELCAGRPELLDDLKRQIEALRSMEQFLDVTGGEPDPALEGDNTPSPKLTSPLPTRAQTGHAPGAPPDGAPVRPEDAGGFDLREYELLERMGSGGMGEIFRGKDPALGRDLAIKVLRPKLRGDPGAEDRFLQEARVTGALQHPNIVPVHNLGRLPDGRLYFTMKLVRGRTLADILAEGTGPSRQPGLLAVFEKVCQAVAFAHSQGVIHRDLKPSNVMVGRFGEVQVMDWGLAKVLGTALMAEEKAAVSTIRKLRTEAATGLVGPAAARGATAAGTVLGTLGYMPPEQAGGDIHKLDEHCDVFGLGAILCEVLTGRPPYAAESWRLLNLAALGDLADTFARLDGCGTDAELVGLVKECLCVEIDKRPRDAGVVAERMAAYQRGVQERLRQAEQQRAAAEARAQEARATARAQRRLVVVVVSAVLVGGVAGGWYLQEQARRQTEMALQRTKAESEAAAALREAGTYLDGEEEQARRDPERWQAQMSLAEAAVHRAEMAIASAEVSQNLRESVVQMRTTVDAKRRDSTLRVELDRIRLNKALVREGYFDYGAAVPGYRGALSGYGVVLGDPQSAGAVVRGSILRSELLAALEDWARYTRENAEKQQLEAVLAAAEPEAGSWRGRWRAAVRGRDGAALAALASDAGELPAADLVNLAWDLGRLGQGAAAEQLLRQGQRRFPDDFWVNNDLGVLLAGHGPAEAVEAVRYLTAAVALRRQSPWAHYNLGIALNAEGNLAEAVEEYHKAIALDSKFAQAHNNLGIVLTDQGKLAEAFQECHKAIALDPKFALAHNNLGAVFKEQGKLAEAVEEYHRAIALDPRLALPHFNLGAALKAQGKLAEAVEEYHRAIALAPRLTQAHNNLGVALADQGKLAEAVEEYHKAIALDPRFTMAHNNLGVALKAQGKVAEAVEEYRRVIALAPMYAVAHNNLGNALQDQGKRAEATEEYRKAIALDPGYAAPHSALGEALLQRGDFAGAAKVIRRCLELLPLQHPLRQPVSQQLQRCEAALATSARLPTILRGDARPANAAEAITLAQICQQFKLMPVAAARFYGEAFDAEPGLADDLPAQHRYNAASCAALAAAGHGKDADNPDAKERQRLRRQALDWLRADLDAWAKQLPNTKAPERENIRKLLEHWRRLWPAGNANGGSGSCRAVRCEGKVKGTDGATRA
jgi:serine/threonine-protein kinase